MLLVGETAVTIAGRAVASVAESMGLRTRQYC